MGLTAHARQFHSPCPDLAPAQRQPVARFAVVAAGKSGIISPKVCSALLAPDWSSWSLPMGIVSFETLCLQAKQAIADRDWETARQIYLQALGLKSDAPDVHYGLATVCFQLRDLPSAAYHFKEVTRLDPLRTGA